MEEERGGAPACSAHELVDGQPVDLETVRDVARFRNAERARLIEARRRISSSDRATAAETLASALDQLIAPDAGVRIAVYWPIRPDPTEICEPFQWNGNPWYGGSKLVAGA